jgi:hypothetical protein
MRNFFKLKRDIELNALGPLPKSDPKSRTLSNWDFDGDGSLSWKDVVLFQFNMALYEEYQERIQLAAKAMCPVLQDASSQLTTFNDLKDDQIDNENDKLFIGKNGTYRVDSCFLPVDNQYTKITFNNVEKTWKEHFTDDNSVSAVLNDILDALPNSTSKNNFKNLFVNKIGKLGSLPFIVSPKITQANRLETTSWSILNHLAFNPNSGEKQYVINNIVRNAFRSAGFQLPNQAAKYRRIIKKIFRVLQFYSFERNNGGTFISDSYLSDVTLQEFPTLFEGSGNATVIQSLIDIAEDEDLGSAFKSELDSEQRAINDELQDTFTKAIFSATTKIFEGGANTVSVDWGFQEGMSIQYKGNFFLQPADLIDDTSVPGLTADQKIRRKVKKYLSRVYEKSIFRSYLPGYKGHLEDSLKLDEFVENISGAAFPYSNASYKADSIDQRNPLKNYTLDEDGDATRFLPHTDVAYFKHNIESIAYPQVREQIIKLVTYKEANGTFNRVLFPDNTDGTNSFDTLTDPNAINFFSKEAADLVSAYLTQHTNYIMLKYVDPDYTDTTTYTDERQTILQGIKNVVSSFTDAKRFYSDKVVIKPTVWEVTRCNDNETYYTYENPYYDYSLSGLFHLANVDQTKGVTPPEFENLFLQEPTGVVYLYNYDIDTLKTIYNNDFYKAGTSDIFLLSPAEIENKLKSYFYEQQTDMSNTPHEKEIYEFCYTVKRDISPPEGYNVLPYIFLPNYWDDTAPKFCQDSRCVPSPSPQPTPSATPTATPSSSIEPSPSPIPTQTPTPTSTPSRLPSPSVTPTVTKTPSPTSTITPTPSSTTSPHKSPSPTPSVTSTQTPTPSTSVTSTPTPTKTITPTPTATQTLSPTPTCSISVSPTRTKSPSRTPSVTRSPHSSPTRTPTMTRTPTPTISRTPDPTRTPSKSRTPSRTPSKTPSKSPSISVSRSPHSSPSKTPSRTPSKSPSQSRTPTPSKSVSRTPSPTRTRTPTPSRKKDGCRVELQSELDYDNPNSPRWLQDSADC